MRSPLLRPAYARVSIKRLFYFPNKLLQPLVETILP